MAATGAVADATGMATGTASALNYYFTIGSVKKIVPRSDFLFQITIVIDT